MDVSKHLHVTLPVLAIIMSSIFLAWQVVSWRRSGPVVKASVTQAAAALEAEAERSPA